LGLPAAYAPLIADPETMFSHFKALVAKDAAPSHNLHPLAPMSQKLDPAYVKKVGDAAFDANVDVVSALDMNDPIIDGLAGAIIDPDGRADKEALAPFAGIVGNSTRAYGRITLTIGCQAMASAEIGAGNDIFAEIRVTEGQTPQRRVHLIALQMSGTTVVPSSAVGEILVPLSTSAVTTIEARLIDSSDTPQNCSASHTVDPAQTPVLAGSIRDIALNTT
jgi:hypothetical protein